MIAGGNQAASTSYFYSPLHRSSFSKFGAAPASGAAKALP
jgi:hypothetical protein